MFLGIIFFLELTAGVLAFVFKDWIKDQLYFFINNNIRAYRDDIDLQNLIDFTQEYVSLHLLYLQVESLLGRVTLEYILLTSASASWSPPLTFLHGFWFVCSSTYYFLTCSLTYMICALNGNILFSLTLISAGRNKEENSSARRF